MSSVDMSRSSPFDPLPTNESYDRSPKHALMGLLADRPNLDARSVAHALQCTHAAAGMLLLRLTRHGLIQRTLDPEGPVYFYNLNEKGRARLAYWAKIEQQRR